MLTSLTPISPVPQRTFPMPRRREASRLAVVKMSVTSLEKRPPDEGSNSVDRSPPNLSRPVVKIAVTSSATREVAGSNPARRSMRR